jgi:N-methylhydantoinase A
VATLKSLKVQAVAVSFINSYVSSRHEDEVASYLRDHLPGVYVTAGTELSREWYEYERTSTAAANAYVGPRLNDYVGRMDRRLRDEGFGRTFFMMASNGGVFSVDRAKQQPVMLVESGPVGGCIGACAYARELGIGKMIAFDMGGTTAKCAVVEDGKFDVKSPYYVGGYDYGFPVHGAVLDIVEVGAGGGSIAWIDEHGRLSVGPLSAGSDPGPVAYGRGGTKPTITDANLTLGRIDAASFLGGEMRLDAPAAQKAIRETIAEPLALKSGADEAAAGILALGVVTMGGAIKQITIERGMDPREFTLFAFGGGGPLHAATLARELSIPEVIIPAEPGNFSAVGMLVSDARVDETYTFIREFNDESLREMADVFGELEARLRLSLSEEIGTEEINFQRNVEMRYRGQKQGIRAEIGADVSTAGIREVFERTYLRRYGHVDAQAPIEFVGLLVTGSARIQGPKLNELQSELRTARPDAQKKRPVYFTERAARLETPVYQRSALKPGFEIDGPAIIEEYGSTTVVGPDDHLRVGTLSELRITFK